MIRLSESEHAEQDLQRVLETLDLVTAQLAASVTRCSRDFRYLWANQAYAEWIQRPLSEIVGRSISDVLGKDAFEASLPHFHRVLAGQKVHNEQQTSFRGIGKRWISATYTPTFDTNGKPNGWIAVVLDVTESKRAEETRRESEERLRLAQQAARIGTFEWNIQTGLNTWTPELEAIYGLPPGGFAGTEAAFENLIHPEDRARIRELVNTTLKSGQPARGEWRAVLPDGSLRWVAGRWQVFMNEAGKPSRIIGVNGDITERKRGEEAVSSMTRKLVEAQEQERARIARELHDDINQRLAMLAVELGQVEVNYPDLPPDVLNCMRRLGDRTTQILADVQSLSHDLHSSQLEYLGVTAGMESWCKEFGERQGMVIDYKHDVRSTLPSEVGLCLFRVLQEALHNSAKHSEIKRIAVKLYEETGQIHLIVSDSGRGFDIEAVRHSKGLGLTSMRERVRLVNGTITIESKPMHGTTVHVRVPVQKAQICKHVAA